MTPRHARIASSAGLMLSLCIGATANHEVRAEPDADKEAPHEITVLAEQGGVLTPKGVFVLEPSLEYVHSSTVRVALEGFTVIPALHVGLFDVRDVERDTFFAALTTRYGITRRLEVEAKVPYVWRSDTTRITNGDPNAGDLITDEEGDDLGDVELALHYQFNGGANGWPYWVGNLRAKSRTGTDPFEVEVDPDTGLFRELPTGSGFWGVEPSLTLIYPTDPAVLFANVRYMWNIERDVNGAGRIDPGDAIGLNFGMGFAVNDKLSFSLGYDHTTVGKTKQNDSNVEGSTTLQIGKFLLGFSIRTTRRTSISLSLAAGLTENAPDMDLTLRVPLSF